MTTLQRWGSLLLGVTLVASALAWACGLWDRPESLELDRFDLVEAAIRDKDMNAVQRLVKGCTLDKQATPEKIAKVAGLFYSAGYVSASETCLEFAINRAGSNAAEYHLRLGTQRFVTGRYWAAQQNWNYLLTHGGFDLISFPALGDRGITFGYEDVSLERGVDDAVQDPLAYLGLGHRAFQAKDFARCETLIGRALELDPNLVDAHLCWGAMLYQQGKVKELSAWLSKMPDRASERPAFWGFLGSLYLQRNSITEAHQCFLHAFSLDPMDYSAVEQVARCRQRLGRTKHVADLLARARKLKDYEDTCRRIHDSERIVEEYLREAERCCEVLGAYREALGWNQILRSVSADSKAAAERAEIYGSRVGEPMVRSNPQFDLRAKVIGSEEPLPSVPSPIESRREIADSKVRFENQSASFGINFTYEDGADSEADRTLLFEFTGGGVAATDFDGDGWPDLFFTQGGELPHAAAPDRVADSDGASDKLFQNHGNEIWQDVTQRAGIVDGYYGQGVAVGDVNSDGWPDLYIANVGKNVLWLNNGDGTFSECQSNGFSISAGWTTSVALADFNGDSLVDIYDVNYASLDQIRTEMCKFGDASAPCESTAQLNAGQDQLFVNRGAGDFVNVTESCGVRLPDGIGLGVVAACFDDDSRLDLFVANDARANFLFINCSDGCTGFTEDGLARGLAYSGTGRAQACMGVAAGDLNGNGLIDLLVTNFYKDYNTLYSQVSDGLFNDDTNVSGLHVASYRNLGFGAQAFDVELDGDLDLIVTNGDVVDFSSTNLDRLYRQSPQFLVNNGSGQFDEVDNARLGEFFSGKYLGRGLALLDYDRDGLEDFAVSHINSPAAVVRNVTECPGHFVDLTLVGVESCRDAVGSRVTLRSHGKSCTRQLTAGSGYMASNERHLIFGLAGESTIDFVSVAWPNGMTERFMLSECDTSYVLVEGSGRAWKCRHESNFREQ